MCAQGIESRGSGREKVGDKWPPNHQRLVNASPPDTGNWQLVASGCFALGLPKWAKDST